eukprot:gene20681-biopygen16135
MAGLPTAAMLLTRGALHRQGAIFVRVPPRRGRPRRDRRAKWRCRRTNGAASAKVVVGAPRGPPPAL